MYCDYYMYRVVYDFFTLENLSQIAQIIIATGAVVSIWQIIKNKKKDEAMLNTIEKQKQFYEMQIEEKEKQQKEKEEREIFEKMVNLVKKIVVNICRKEKFDEDIEFTEEKIKNIIKNKQLTKKEKIIRDILLMKLPIKVNIFIYFMKASNNGTNQIFTLQDEIWGGYPFDLYIKNNKCIFLFRGSEFYYPDDNTSKKESIISKESFIYTYMFDNSIFLSNGLSNVNFEDEDLNKLKRELPKILTPYVFDGEKLIVKDE